MVADTMLPTGNVAPSTADNAATSNARPSHNNTLSGVAGTRGAASATVRSALDTARVQRLNAGASGAAANSTTTHME